ncbi:MAG: undecaprenyl-diphosphatase UppP [Gemmatimonadaceae bacterium]|nr:undecaprenyl-diphosphatase UppP [Gemmatimonadaceae bacterium]
MTVFEAIVLGLVQGLAEFLPISSSAHLALAPWVLGWEDPGLAFDVALHLGTLLALLWFFRHDWIALARSGWGVLRTRRVEGEEARRVIFIALGTIPAAITGVVLADAAESTLRAPRLIATTLIVMGILLWQADRAGPRDRSLGQMRWLDAAMIGVAQAFALIPGVSRSGATITAGRALGFDRASAARFSFLLSFPITAAAVVVKVPDALRTGGLSAPLVAGIVAAALSSGAAIAILLRYVSRRSYGIFALYRVIAGLGILALWYARR